MKYILRTIDFETTGIPTDEEPHSVVEAAYVDTEAETKEHIGGFQTLVKPTTDMDIKALAVHHIPHEDAFDGGVEWFEAQDRLQACDPDVHLVYVAHNADFEKEFFNPKDAKWIDTYKVALKLYPDAPSHSNQVMKYYLGISDSVTHHPPHRALPDCHVTAEILVKMSEKATFNEMIKISKEPPYLTKIGFGKHYGQKFEDVPLSYLTWVLTQADMDDGVKAAAERQIASRGQA